MTITEDILLRSLLLFLMIGSVAGLLAGVALIVRPELMMRMGKWTNRWVSTRHLNKALEKPINVEHWIYRYRHVSGTAILAGAFFIIYSAVITKPAVLASLFKNSIVPPPLMEALMDALVLIVLISAVSALIVGLFLLFRPSLLREFEQRANQASSMRRAIKPLEIPRPNVDEYVFRHAQRAGVLLLIGSVYALVGLATWLN